MTSALVELDARDEVMRGPPGPGSLESYRVPTAELGVWMRIVGSSGDPPAISLVRSDGVRILTSSEDCAISWRAEASAPAAFAGGPERFTDDDLRAALLASGGSAPTVVYVWSPHMSLSVDGYAEISAASESLGLGLVGVLFPEGDVAFARREATRAGIPEDALKEAASVELAFRDALVHAPSIVVFDGQRVSPVLPGYRDAAGYRRFLEEFLPGR